MTVGINRIFLWYYISIEILFACVTGSDVDGCKARTKDANDDAVGILDVMMLPVDAIRWLWSHHYVVIIVFLMIDGVLKLADWILEKPDVNSSNNASCICGSTQQNHKTESSNTDGPVQRRAKPTKDENDSESSNLAELRNFNRHSQTPPFKSMSMTEADNRHKEMGQAADMSRPVAIHYYYGKLIQVTSPQQVQIGDYNTMEVTRNSTDEESDGELSVNRDSESDGELAPVSIRSSSCTDLLEADRHLMTDDQKTLARSDSHSAPDKDSDSRRHSMDAAFVTQSKEQYRQSTGSLDTINPGLSEELFVEARFKIFKAAEEYRRSKQEEDAANVSDKRKSKKFPFKKKT